MKSSPLNIKHKNHLFHHYIITLVGLNDGGSTAYASIFLSVEKNVITKSNINECRQRVKDSIGGDACVLSASYLGLMTQSQFNDESHHDHN